MLNNGLTTNIGLLNRTLRISRSSWDSKWTRLGKMAFHRVCTKTVELDALPKGFNTVALHYLRGVSGENCFVYYEVHLLKILAALHVPGLKNSQTK